MQGVRRANSLSHQQLGFLFWQLKECQADTFPSSLRRLKSRALLREARPPRPPSRPSLAPARARAPLNQRVSWECFTPIDSSPSPSFPPPPSKFSSEWGEGWGRKRVQPASVLTRCLSNVPPPPYPSIPRALLPLRSRAPN